jgi:drug/metabolite transporter (DMT)-like permease
MKHISKEILGTYGIVFVALVWGLGFPAVKVVSGSIPTFYLIGLRFLIASVLLCIIFFRRLKEINKTLIRSAFILSIILFLTYGFATLGIQYTTSAKASFFSCLGLLVVPIIMRLFFKEKVKARVFISIILCTIGLFLISYTRGMGFYLSSGDIICLGCSVCGAFHLVITGRVANDRDPALLAIVQLLFISVWSFAAAFFLEDFPASIPTFHWVVLIYLAVFGTAVATFLQIVCQRYVHASRAGVILSIEPVSGALFSALLLGDRLGINGILGGTLIFSSLIFMEAGESKCSNHAVATDVSLNQIDIGTDMSFSQISENIPSQERQEQCDTSQRP